MPFSPFVQRLRVSLDTGRPIPLLSSQNVIPITLCNPDLVDVVHRVRRRPQVARGFGYLPLAGGVQANPCALGIFPAKMVRFHWGNVDFSQYDCPPPPPTILHPTALNWSEWTGRA